MEEERVEEKEEKRDPYEDIIDLFEGMPAEQVHTEVAKWKRIYGKVIKLALGGQHYLIRPLSRIEAKGIMSGVVVGPTTTQEEYEQRYEENVVQKCTLLPAVTPEFFSNCPAGTITALMVAINFHSNVLPPELVIASTEEL